MTMNHSNLKIILIIISILYRPLHLIGTICWQLYRMSDSDFDDAPGRGSQPIRSDLQSVPNQKILFYEIYPSRGEKC